VLLLDVTPLSLGIETLGGVMTKLVERNTTIPTARSQVFSTASDNQSEVEVHVLQGEREMARDNRSLGRFHLDGIAPAPRGIPQIEVSFDLDANGILDVKATDKGTGKEQKVRITASSTLSKAEVEKLVSEAAAHSSEDRKNRELIELRNQADAMVYAGEKSLREAGEGLDEQIKHEVSAGAEALKTAIRSADSAGLQQAMDNFNVALQKIGSSEGARTSPSESGDGRKEDDNVVDAEYKEV
jgi:molecular chaperone DnaK